MVYCSPHMSGHNKWSKIKHKKASTDAQKSKIFGKMAQLLTAESKKNNGDRNSPGLKSAIEQAKSVNMPSQNIDRAIERGADADAASFESVTYEAYGPGGCALLIETLTDNRNRTAAEIRHILSLHNTAISAPGSAAWIFARENNTVSPNTTVQVSEEDKEKIKSLVSDLTNQNDTQEVYTNEV